MRDRTKLREMNTNLSTDTSREGDAQQALRRSSPDLQTLVFKTWQSGGKVIGVSLVSPQAADQPAYGGLSGTVPCV